MVKEVYNYLPDGDMEFDGYEEEEDFEEVLQRDHEQSTYFY